EVGKPGKSLRRAETVAIMPLVPKSRLSISIQRVRLRGGGPLRSSNVLPHSDTALRADSLGYLCRSTERQVKRKPSTAAVRVPATRDSGRPAAYHGQKSPLGGNAMPKAIADGGGC